MDLSPSKIKAIIFDKDGTLIDFERSWAPGMEAWLLGIAPKDLKLRKDLASVAGYSMETGKFVGGAVFVNGTADDTMNAFKKVAPKLDFDLVARLGEKAFANNQPAPICDLKKLMKTFQSSGLKLGVVTNASEASAMAELEKLDCLNIFEMVIGCDSGFVPKPSGDTILAFCDQVGLSPRQVAMVGDSTHDLEAGCAAGVGLNVGVLSGPATRDQIEHGADVVLDDITQLPDLLAREFN